MRIISTFQNCIPNILEPRFSRERRKAEAIQNFQANSTKLSLAARQVPFTNIFVKNRAQDLRDKFPAEAALQDPLQGYLAKVSAGELSK